MYECTMYVLYVRLVHLYLKLHLRTFNIRVCTCTLYLYFCGSCVYTRYNGSAGVPVSTYRNYNYNYNYTLQQVIRKP